MLLLALIALLAGAGTVFSPCILPILPAVLAGAATGGSRRPLGIVIGLALSFTFAVVALTYLIDALGLPNDTNRIIAIAIIAGFGVVLLVPALSQQVEAYASRLVRVPSLSSGDGFASGLLLGAGLGFAYFPCAGPILAAVVGVSISQDFSLGQLVIALAYGLGTALALLAVLRFGRRILDRFRPKLGLVGPITGAVMVAIAIGLVLDLDTRFTNYIADNLPDQVTNPTTFLEESEAIQDDLAALRGGEVRAGDENGGRELAAGEELPVVQEGAPEFTGTQEWFNTGGEELTMRDLRAEGEVVLIDFWTYTCINCLRTLPYLTAWDRKYGDAGLTIVGVHAPEFPFERDADNVRGAIAENDISYPVVQDNDLATWTAWHNQYWPAKYLVDAQGNVRYFHFGEGDYEETERAIRSLLAEAGNGPDGRGVEVEGEVADPGVRTPETYLGSARAQGFLNGPLANGRRDYGDFGDRVIKRLPPNAAFYQGTWNISSDGATAVKDARLDLSFTASEVYLVLGADRGGRNLRVELDGEPISNSLAGPDVVGGVARIFKQRLYRLVSLPRAEAHVLTLKAQPGISGYAFTFG